ncbi:dynein regulatory complex protein 9-like isoform X1 [Atheta coriaria]|uniref:dynein regulatory complex protein 9-like isoform X1 n=1 Tax=Dalotia coriaria TaxID=877792 RepID=UPI0031F37A33
MSDEESLEVNITSNETKQLESLLEQTLNQLYIARQVAIQETSHLDNTDREIIQNDYKTAITIFEELKNEISQHSTFNSLVNFVEQKEEGTHELNRAKLKAKQTQHTLKVLKNEIAVEKNKINEETQALNVQLGMLKDQYQDELWEQGVKLRYSTDWLQAQSKQHEIQLEKNAHDLKNQVDQLEKTLEQEHRVHDELEDFYSMKLGEYIQQLVYWVDKYEHDKNDYDQRIATIKSEHANLLERMTAAKELYASRQAEITAYEEIKEKRRLEEIHLAHLNANATKIQAWWRGMMVRCKLGPYKVKKSKGKGKNKNK